MKNLNRRDLCVALSAFAALGTVSAEAQTALSPGGLGEKVLSQSETFPFDQLAVNRSTSGVAARASVRGVLATGEAVEVHETTLAPGKMPHPPHKHRHSEFILIRDGLLEFDNDGTAVRVGPGAVVFAASEVMHGLKNVGETAANYFVVAIGRETGVTPV